MTVVHQRVFQGPNVSEVTATTDVQYIVHRFTCPPGLGSSEIVHQDLLVWLTARGYNEDWIVEFELAAEEALSDACEHTATAVHGFLLVVSHDGIDHVSVLISNDIRPGHLENLDHLDQPYDCADHLEDTRGRGFSIMRALVDGVVVSLVVDRMFWTVLEKDYVPAKK